MPKTILLVDDEPLLLSIFRRHLMKQGFAVLTAVNAIEALDMFNDHASIIHTIVVDIHLPGELCGWDVVNQVQSSDFSPKVVCISGEAKPLSTPEIHAFLLKPFRVQQLVELIQIL